MCIDNWALAPVCVSTIGDKKNKLFQEIGTFLFIKVENALLFLNNKNKDFLWKKYIHVPAILDIRLRFFIYYLFILLPVEWPFLINRYGFLIDRYTNAH